MDCFSSDFTLGVLGGGQLGKMLLYQTQRYDIRTAVLDPSQDSPCRHSCHRFEIGDWADYDTVYKFGKTVDLLTFEIEHVNIDALERLVSEGSVVYPSPDTLKIIQDKISQKKFLKEKGIPTADFEVFNSRPETEKMPFVWKCARFGYDGYGVKIVRDKQQLRNLPDKSCIVESLINFKYEVSVIVARSSKGEVKNYPVVEMEFHPKANQVEYVLCPARIDIELQQRIIDIALQTSKAFDHVGLLAVEMFIKNDNTILVNEVAPRPHNSGHLTIEMSYTDQFEQHLRAISGLPLGSPRSKTSAVMVNLVGSESHHGAVYYRGMDKILALEGVSAHIYGKKATKPFRKMGHITVCNNDVDTARTVAERVKSTVNIISKTK